MELKRLVGKASDNYKNPGCKRELPLKVFYSYSHNKIDNKLSEVLAKHLRVLERENMIIGWYDRKIGPGKEWKDLIDKRLEEADIILLLISADFFDSDYCYNVEKKRAMKRHRAGEVCVIPVILRPVEWKSSQLGKLQALPNNGRPVTIWKNRDLAFSDITRGILKAVKELTN